jgi:hypothetical protein
MKRSLSFANLSTLEENKTLQPDVRKSKSLNNVPTRDQRIEHEALDDLLDFYEEEFQHELRLLSSRTTSSSSLSSTLQQTTSSLTITTTTTTTLLHPQTPTTTTANYRDLQYSADNNFSNPEFHSFFKSQPPPPRIGTQQIQQLINGNVLQLPPFFSPRMIETQVPSSSESR